MSTSPHASWIRSMTIRGFVKAMNKKMPMPFPLVKQLCDENGINIHPLSISKPVREATKIMVRYENDSTNRIIRIFPA